MIKSAYGIFLGVLLSVSTTYTFAQNIPDLQNPEFLEGQFEDPDSLPFDPYSENAPNDSLDPSETLIPEETPEQIEEQSPEPTPEREQPPKKTNHNTAVFTGLDKITARLIEFEVLIDETVQFGALQITPKVCTTKSEARNAQTASYINVDEITLEGTIKPLFAGWIFAESPGINAIEHPVYDIWLKACVTKTGTSEEKPSEEGLQRLPKSEIVEGVEVAPNVPLRTPSPRNVPAGASKDNM